MIPSSELLMMSCTRCITSIAPTPFATSCTPFANKITTPSSPPDATILAAPLIPSACMCWKRLSTLLTARADSPTHHSCQHGLAAPLTNPVSTGWQPPLTTPVSTGWRPHSLLLSAPALNVTHPCFWHSLSPA